MQGGTFGNETAHGEVGNREGRPSWMEVGVTRSGMGPRNRGPVVRVLSSDVKVSLSIKTISVTLGCSSEAGKIRTIKNLFIIHAFLIHFHTQ